MRTETPVPYSLSSATSVVLASGAVAALIGLTVIVSWHAEFESLLQIRSDYRPMAYNTAVALTLSSLAMLLLVVGRYRLAWITALFVAGASLLTLAQGLFSIDLGIDRLLFDGYALTEATSPGRMSPQTAVGLIAACLAIALASRRRHIQHRSFVLAIAGSLVVAVGGVALSGYLTGFEHAYGWGRFSTMSAQAAAGFLALGTGVVALGWREARATSSATPRWLFAPIVIGVSAVSILFCQALLSYEDRQIDLAVRAEAAVIQHEVESELAASVAIIDRTGVRWERSGRPSQTRWQDDVGLNFDSPILFQAIEWVDPFYKTRWVTPPPSRGGEIGANFMAIPELRATLDAALSQRQIVISQPIDRGRDDLEIFVVRPLHVDGTFDGFIVGVFRVNQLFGELLNDRVSPTSSIAVYTGNQRIFTRTSNNDSLGENWQVEAPAVVLNSEWTLRVWPASVDAQRSLMPYVALLVGFVVAGLLGLVTWLLQQARFRALAIQRTNVTLQVEVIERIRAEEELRYSTGALERSNRSLQEFAYVASHDLKAPLVSLQGLAAMLKDDFGDRLDGDGRLYLDRIVVNATKMRNLLDDLLELSRVGREDAPVSAVDLGCVIDGVTDQLRQILNQRGAQVIIGGPLPVVAGNPVRLHQVFSNLIDNALKYTPPEREPRIEIDASDAGESWQVCVRDNGAGIPPEHRDKIFTMFQRLPKGRAMNPTGTGMGLAIVSRIVEANGGRCWIAASDEGGTTFCLTFPKTASPSLSHAPRTPQPAGVA